MPVTNPPEANGAMAHRTFRDSLGRKWDVWTVTPSKIERRDRSAPAVPPDPPGVERRKHEEYRVLLGNEWSRGWLAFETAGEKRRLARYPDDWDEMQPEQLQELCQRAVEVTPSRRLVE